MGLIVATTGGARKTLRDPANNTSCSLFSMFSLRSDNIALEADLDVFLSEKQFFRNHWHVFQPEMMKTSSYYEKVWKRDTRKCCRTY